MLKDNQHPMSKFLSMFPDKSKQEHRFARKKSVRKNIPKRRCFSDIELKDLTMKSQMNYLKRQQNISPINRKISPGYSRSSSAVQLKKLNLTMHNIVNSCKNSHYKKIKIPRNAHFNPYLYKNALSIVLDQPGSNNPPEKRNELIGSIQNEIDQLDVKQEVIQRLIPQVRKDWDRIKRKFDREELKETEKKLRSHLNLLSKIQMCKEKLKESLIHCAKLN